MYLCVFTYPVANITKLDFIMFCSSAKARQGQGRWPDGGSWGQKLCPDSGSAFKVNFGQKEWKSDSFSVTSWLKPGISWYNAIFQQFL